MKRKYLITHPGWAGVLLLTTTLLSTARADYSSTVLSQGPVGYWRLAETQAPHAPVTNAVNSGTLGAAENAPYLGDQGFYRGFPGALGANGSAAQFNGVDQQVQVPYNAALNPPSWTVEAWLAPATAEPTGGLLAALACGHFGSPRSGWLLYQSVDATGKTGWDLRLYNQNGLNTSLNLTALTPIVPGVFQHVAASFDGTTASIYVNGALITNGVASGYVPGTDGPFTIGARSDGGFLWPGKADEVAFYNTVLTPAQIAAHYSTATTNPAGYADQVNALNPLVYFRLDEPGDPPAANEGTLAHAADGSYLPGSQPGVAGPRTAEFSGFEGDNTAVSFDGTGGSVTVPALNLNANTVTITAWVKPNGTQNKATGLVVSDSGSTYAGLTIDPNFNGLGLGYVWNDDPNTTSFSPGVDLALPNLVDSDWSFVALVVQPNEAEIYVGPGTTAASFAAATNYTAHIVQAFEGPTEFGADPGTFTTSRVLKGAIDEVAIFDRSLAAGEVYSQYAAAIGHLAPKLFQDIADVSIYAGEPLHLVGDIGGTPPLSFQWFKDGSPLAGATQSSYALASPVPGDSGKYQLVVTNGFGRVNSSTATVAVAAPTMPSVLEGFTGRTLYPGGSLNLQVMATGGQLSYQWSKDSNPIPGATTSAYSVSSIANTDGGDYSLLITNPAGSTTVGPATIKVVVPAAGSYESLVVADKPEGWWRLDDAPNSTDMLDSMGRHDGYYTNSLGSPPTLGATGAIAGSTNTAASSDGTIPWIGIVPYTSALGANNFSLECWAKVPDAAGDYCAVSLYQGTGGEFLYADSSSGTWRAAIGPGSDPYLFYYLGDTTGNGVIANRWMHLVFTYQTGVGIRAYINGQYNQDWSGAFPRNGTGPLLIGGVSGASGLNYHFKGTVDEVAFYPTALSQTRVQAHYAAARFPTPTAPAFVLQPNSQGLVVGNDLSLSALADGSPTITYQWLKGGEPLAGQTATTLTLNSVGFGDAGNYQLEAANSVGTNLSQTAVVTVSTPYQALAGVTNGLVLHLRFDGDLTDATGRGNSGTAQGAPTFVNGIIGSGALHYNTDTTNSIYNYVTLGTPTDLRFSSNVSFSVSYWVKLPADSLSGDLPFLCSSVNSYGNFGMTFAPSYQAGGWSWSLGDSRATGAAGAPVTGLYGAGNSINDGQWHSLVHAFDREAALATTYLDGLDVDETPMTDLGSIDSPGPIDIGQDATGTYQESGQANLDDLAIWRRALSAAEAYSIYYVGANSGKSFDAQAPVTLSITPQGKDLIISWQVGTLEQASDLKGPWTPVSNASAPSYKVTPGSGNLFFRVKL